MPSFLRQFGKLQKNKIKLKKGGVGSGGDGGGGGREGGVATSRLYFSVIKKKSLGGWMRTGRLTYALIREH